MYTDREMTLDGLVRGTDVDQRMHHLVTIHAEDGCTEEALCVGVEQYLHETLGLACFASAADALHRNPRAQRAPAAGQGFGLRHADAAQRQVDEERIARSAGADAARVAVEQVRHHDLVVVPGRVRERTPPVAVTHGPDDFGAGAAWSSTSM
jgi:hypothetical protein